MRLTIRRLEAMSRALAVKTAGKLKDYERFEDYDEAHDWVSQELARRRARRKQPEMF
jgi:hypothetical protein